MYACKMSQQMNRIISYLQELNILTLMMNVFQPFKHHKIIGFIQLSSKWNKIYDYVYLELRRLNRKFFWRNLYGKQINSSLITSSSQNLFSSHRNFFCSSKMWRLRKFMMQLHWFLSCLLFSFDIVILFMSYYNFNVKRKLIYKN